MGAVPVHLPTAVLPNARNSAVIVFVVEDLPRVPLTWTRREMAAKARRCSRDSYTPAASTPAPTAAKIPVPMLKPPHALAFRILGSTTSGDLPLMDCWIRHRGPRPKAATPSR